MLEGSERLLFVRLYMSPVSSFLSLKARNKEKRNEIDRLVAVIRIFTIAKERQK
jgi:hypothetical protein